MKILVLLSRVPYPLEKGDKLRAFHQIKHLSEEHEILLVCLNDSPLHPDAEKMLAPYCKELRIFKISKLAILLNLFRGILSNKPFQVHYFFHKSIQKQIENLIEQHLPKHIYCQLVRVTEYAKKYSVIPKTLDYMDALSKGVDRRIQKSPWYLRPFLRTEAKRMREYEREVFDVFQNKTIISAQDRELIDHPHKKEIQIIANGVNMEYFHPMVMEKDTDLVFTGNMSYPPNVDSACFLVEKIMPLVWESRPETTLLISGVNPAARVKKLEGPKVSVTGWVEDIRTSYARAKIFVAPMQLGTGLQNKLLEAMAMEIPCITSQLANNALGATPQKDVLIGNSPEEFKTLIINLLSDQNLYKEVGKNGHQFAILNFDWKQKTEDLKQLMIPTPVYPDTIA